MLVVAALLTTGALLHSGHGNSMARSGSRTAVATMSGAYDFSARDLRTGNVQELSAYEGKVSLIVNVASQ